MQRLPEDSLTAALHAGGRELFGWKRDLSVLSDIFDAINVNTKATGNWKSKPPELPRAHRPSLPSKSTDQDAAPAKPRTSVSDLFKRVAARRT